MDRRGTQVENLRHEAAFTIVEVLVVMTIILVVAGLILSTSSYVHNKGARARAEAEIAAMSAALESYKADNGVYPDDPTIDPATDFNPADYQASSLDLYKKLSGDSDANGQADTTAYMTFKDNQLQMTGSTISYLKDPFGNSYGYSTTKADNPSGSKGYNPTYDLWSSGGSTGGTTQTSWIKNW